MKKAAKISALLAVFLLCMALFAYKAYSVYADIRTQLNVIEENARNSVDALSWNVELSKNILSKTENAAGRYSFDYSWLDETDFIAHALGGIDGCDYTNSKEAMEKAYADGFRVFEGDMQLLDGRVVLVHDNERFEAYTGLDCDGMSYEQFMDAKILGKYSPVDIKDVVVFLSEHPDAYFMTDSKYMVNPYSANILSAFVIEALEYDASVLDRVIIQIYNQKMLESVMDIYEFKSVLYTLYSSSDTDEEALDFCLRSGVGVITVPRERMTEEFAVKMEAVGVKTLTHTVNDLSEASAFFDMGVDCIYTDFILPSQMQR